MRILLVFLLPFLFGCMVECENTYTERDEYGNLKKYHEYSQNGQCLKDNVPLTFWEDSVEKRTKRGIACKPVSTFPSRSLKSSGNLYTYRDDRVLLDLNSSTGEYRRIVYGEGKDGQKTFIRQQGCFYERDGYLFLDTDNAASSTAVTHWEVFTYQESGGLFVMSRWEQTQDWDFRFCITLKTPWESCTVLRNGNILYYSSITAQKQTDLLAEAKFQRTQYAFVNNTSFEASWASLQGKEIGQDDWKYTVVFIPDTPWFIDAAMKDYVKGDRPIPPDFNSPQLPMVCYNSWRNVTLDDGTISKIKGEVCLIDGQYHWSN